MCKLCETNSVYEFTNKRKLCKSCFIRWFEKKFLYTIRKFKMISRGEIVSYSNSNSFRDVVLNSLLKMYSEKGIAKIVKSKAEKIALSSTVDSEAKEIINIIIKGDADKLNNKPVVKVNRKIIIKPLYLFLDKEILLYAKLKGLKFEKIKEKKDKIELFIEDLEKKHPEIKHSIVNSYLELMG